MFNLAADGGTAPAGSQTPGLQTAGSPTSGARLELALAAIEGRLAALDEALRTRDMAGIDLHASELQRRLANAVDPFTRAARSGAVPPEWRVRLAMAGAQVAAQRQSLARATAALDRAIDVLLPAAGSALYSTHGSPQRAARGAAAQA